MRRARFIPCPWCGRKEAKEQDRARKHTEDKKAIADQHWHDAFRPDAGTPR